MKKLLILTVLIFSLLIVSPAKAGYIGGYAYCTSTSNTYPYASCSAWLNGIGWETYYKSNSNLLILYFNYYLGSSPAADGEYASGTITWNSSDPNGAGYYSTGINKMWWDIDPTPREEWVNDYYSEPGNLYIEAISSDGYTGYPGNGSMYCYAAWW